MTTADVRWQGVSEAAFQEAVVRYAKLRGFYAYHNPDSRRSEAGWPDLVLIRPPRFVLVELKREDGRVSPRQRQVQALLEACGLETYVWYPRDWNAITALLERRAA